MILQVDAGNTRVHWRLVKYAYGQDPVVIERGHVTHGRVPDPVGREAIARVELACVAGEDVSAALKRALSNEAGVPVAEAKSQGVACGVHNSYLDPGAMGVDRWLAMVAGFHHYPGGVIIVDAGTAITVDYVDAKGNHLGGYILPGLNLMAQALGGSTARVRAGGGSFGPAMPGRSTAEGVNHGVSWLGLSAAERLHQDLQALGLSTIVLTGGDSDFMAQHLGNDAAIEPDLVFMGMDLVFADTPLRSGVGA